MSETIVEVVSEVVNEVVIPSDFHIVLTELYDADVMDAILRDTSSFSKRDLNNLSRYKKGRKGGNEVEVIYHYGKGCEKDQVGRLYVKGGEGLQSFPFDIRNPLLENFYWDADMSNCHYVLISKLGKDLGVSTVAIDEYNNNRDVALSKLSSNRKFSKTAFLKAMYGGDIKLYNDFYSDEEHIIDGDKTLLKRITTEITTITDLMYGMDKYEYIRKIIKANKKKNPKFSMLSLILQTEERKCLLEMLNYMKSQNRSVDILIHDGCEIRKLLNETEFPAHLLRECEEYIKSKTGYIHRLELKPLKHNFKLNEDSNDSEVVFKILSKEFEKTHAKIIDLGSYIKEYDDKVIMMSKEKIKSAYEHMKCGINKMGFNVSFIDKWMKLNDNIRKYTTIDMYPNTNECPSDTYNLWRPFAFQLYEGNYEPNEEGKNRFFNHVKILCNNDDTSYKYVLKWIVHMMKYPHKKSTTPTFLSDQGSGKGTLIKFITIILGNKKVFETAEPSRDVWGNFNEMMKDCYLVVLNELNKKESKDSEDKIKMLQTDPSLTINIKGGTKFVMKSYHHFMITSNNENPIKSVKGDRRNFITKSSDEKKGDLDYFTQLNKDFEDINIIRTIVDALLEIEVNENFGSEVIPLTEYQTTLQDVERKPIDLWLEQLTINHSTLDSINLSPTECLTSYKDWCKSNGFNSDGMNVQKFGLNIVNCFNDKDRDTYIIKKRSNTGMNIAFNIVNLKIKYKIEEPVVIDM